MGEPKLTLDDVRRIPGIEEGDIHTHQFYTCLTCGWVARHMFTCHNVQQILYVELKQ